MTILCAEGATTNSEILLNAGRIFHLVQLSIARGAQKAIGANISIPNSGIEKNAFDFFKKHLNTHGPAIKRISELTKPNKSNANSFTKNIGAFSPVLNLNKSILMQAAEAKALQPSNISKIIGLHWNSAANKLETPADINDYARILMVDVYQPKKILTQSTSSQQSQKQAKELVLKIKKFKAKSIYGWEITDWGNDSIYCGGNGLAPGYGPPAAAEQIGQIKVPRFKVGNFVQNGQTINLNPDKVFVKFDLTKVPSNAWPCTFSANAFISESDASGDFVEFLDKLWDEVGEKIITLATALALTAVGAGAGASAGSSVAPLVGTIIGAIVGAVIGYVVGWTIDSLKDDIFDSPENPIATELLSRRDLFEGNKTRSPTYTDEHTLGGARYIMHYYWELIY